MKQLASASVMITALREAYARFDSDSGWPKSSHVAMSTMLALFPFCIFALSLAGQLTSDLSIDDMVAFVYGAWPDAIAEPITNELRAVLSQSGAKTTLFGAVLAIYFASNGIDAVREVVSDAYRDKDPRPLWRRRLICVAFVFAGAILIALAGALSVGLPLYLRSAEVMAPAWITAAVSSDALRLIFTALLLTFAVYACHAWLPGVRRTARDVMPGVVLNMVLWGVAGQVFSIYFTHFSSYSVTYAGLAGVMAALVFLYVMAVIFVFCAEFNGRLHAARMAARPAP
jgi:membrane protein